MRRTAGLLVVLAALVSAPAAGAVTRDDLVGRTFVIDQVLVDGQPRGLVGDGGATIGFGPDGMGFHAACNWFGGRGWRLVEGRVLVGEWAMTEVGCDPDLMAQDELLSRALTAQPTVELAGNALILRGPAIELRATDARAVPPYRPLTGTAWAINGVEADGSVRGEAWMNDARLVFMRDGHLTLATTCGTVAGTYTLADWMLSTQVLTPPAAPCDAGGTFAQTLVILGGPAALTGRGDEVRVTSARGAVTLFELPPAHLGAALSGRRFALDRAHVGTGYRPLVGGRPIPLVLGDGGWLRVDPGCHVVTGRWRIRGGLLVATRLRVHAGPCANRHRRGQERWVLGLLARQPRVDLRGPSLVLAARDASLGGRERPAGATRP